MAKKLTFIRFNFVTRLRKVPGMALLWFWSEIIFANMMCRRTCFVPLQWVPQSNCTWYAALNWVRQCTVDRYYIINFYTNQIHADWLLAHKCQFDIFRRLFSSEIRCTLKRFRCVTHRTWLLLLFIRMNNNVIISISRNNKYTVRIYICIRNWKYHFCSASNVMLRLFLIGLLFSVCYIYYMLTVCLFGIR